MVRIENPISESFISCARFCGKLPFSDVLPKELCFHCFREDYMTVAISAAVSVNFEKRPRPTTTTPLTRQMECELVTCEPAAQVLPPYLAHMDGCTLQHQHLVSNRGVPQSCFRISHCLPPRMWREAYGRITSGQQH